MAPSQLKQLKASLREHNITGPSKSKRQKKSSGKADANARQRRNVVLQSIRETFNPFENKASSRPRKFEVTSRQSANGARQEVTRSGVTKSLGEQAVWIQNSC
jgi:nucleolar protein 14